MKNCYKILIGCFVVCLLLVVADFAVGTWCEMLYHKSKYGIYHRQLYCLNKSNDDILIMGSSRAAHHYIPQIFEDSLGMNCYNAGSDGQCIYYHYALLASMLERGAKPRLVLYEVMNLDAEVSSIGSFTLDAALDRLAPHYGEYRAIDELFNQKKCWMENLKLKSKTYRYNSKLVQIIKCNYIPSPEYKGYEALIGKMDIKSFTKDLEKESNTIKHKSADIDGSKLEYVKKFIMLCKENDIRLVFMYSPYYNSDLSYGTKLIKKIAESEGIPFYDFVTNSIFNTPEYFKDVMHLNDEGAREYSKYIIQYL